MAYKLDPSSEPGAELIRIIGDRLEEAIRASGNRRQPVKVRIHTARTACKKARAALKLLRSGQPKRTRRENRALRDAARDLSALRDADAMLASFDSLLKHRALPKRRFAPLRLALQHHRRTITPSATAIERRFRAFRTNVQRVRHRLKHGQPEVTFESLLADFIRTYARARGTLRAVQRKPSGRHFHEWRKATKAVYYQCRLLRGAWKPAMKERADELQQLGALLGDEHDLTILRRTLRVPGDLPLSGGFEKKRALLLELLASRRAALRAAAVSLGERLYADKPSAIAIPLRRQCRVELLQSRS